MRGLPLTVLLISTSCIAAWDDTKTSAIRNGAEVKLLMHIVDDQGSAIPGARISYGFSDGYNKFKHHVGNSNQEGNYKIIGNCRFYVSYNVCKEGFYATEGKVDYANSKICPAVVEGKWQPYGENISVVLKRIHDPRTEFVSDEIQEFGIPSTGKWLPFDLEKQQWLPPHGTGKCGDVLLRFFAQTNAVTGVKEFNMDVSFTNNPFAGVYEAKVCPDSVSQSVSFADPEANYLPTVKYCFVSDPANPRNNRVQYLSDGACLVFRTRTSVDEEGRLKNAHYGKIYGLWMGFGTWMKMTECYFNQNENDTNIEADRRVKGWLKKQRQ